MFQNNHYFRRDRSFKKEVFYKNIFFNNTFCVFQNSRVLFNNKMVKDCLEIEKGIVLFDGVCNFCKSTVLFIIKYDKKNKLLFTSQQSEIGIKLLNENGYYQNSLKTIIFIKNKKVFF